jgi:hypothetical protein
LAAEWLRYDPAPCDRPPAPGRHFGPALLALSLASWTAVIGGTKLLVLLLF